MNTRTLFAILAICCLFSCKKNSDSDVSSTQIKLDPLSISGNLVTLKWSKLNSSNLQYYEIIKMIDTTVPSSGTVIKVDKNTTEYTDTLRTVPYIQYSVAGISAVSHITSNAQLYVCNGVSFMNIFPVDALLDRSAQRLYIYDVLGHIMLYDLQSRSVVKQISTGTNIGYCDIGTYNGQKELYVPRGDGYLCIYDGNTLSQVDQIYAGIQGSNAGPANAVLYNNGTLFLRGAFLDSFAFISYNRSSKAIISQRKTSVSGKMTLIPGTNTEFYGKNLGTAIPWYARFDGAGNFVSDTVSTYGHSEYYEFDDFEILPGGNGVIVSPLGDIFDRQLKLISTLPYGTAYLSTFAVDSTDQIVYAGTNNNGICEKKIRVYSLSSYQQTDSVIMQGYPIKIFYNNGSLISISSIGSFIQGSLSTDIIFVEQH